MKPWTQIDEHTSPDGKLELLRRGDTDFLLKHDGRVLMNSWANLTERALASAAIGKLGTKEPQRVLIGGLGLGYTLRETLTALSKNSHVVVAELNPIIVEWCRRYLPATIQNALTDPRVEIRIEDVAKTVKAAASSKNEGYDAIIYDLYEGPRGSQPEKYEALYGDNALRKVRAALRSGGVFAVWSEEPDDDFEKRLQRRRFEVQRLKPGKGGPRHAVVLATIKDAAPAGDFSNPRETIKKEVLIK